MTATTTSRIRTSVALLGVVAGCAFALPACGSGSPTLADASHGKAFKISAHASFATTQRLAKQAVLKVTVRNEDTRPLPDVAVTVEGLDHQIPAGNNGVGKASDPNRPNWIIDVPPPGGTTAYTNTWALGPLPAGQARTFVWRLTPVVGGRHRVTWRVGGGTAEKAPVTGADGAATSGAFSVRVTTD